MNNQKLLLTSAGITNQLLTDVLGELAKGTNKKIGFIPTADGIEAGDKDWYIAPYMLLA